MRLRHGAELISGILAQDGLNCILANADLRVSALRCSASRSSSDIGGSRILDTPLRPRTLGNDNLTSYSALYKAIGMTAGSFRDRISAMRAHAIPIPC